MIYRLTLLSKCTGALSFHFFVGQLARWTCQAIIAGVDYMKMGYVSRAHAKDNQHHFILGTELFRPLDFAKQIELKTATNSQ